ncbi:hypothetical protein [Streptomyces sp. SID12501]|uniref:Uncharacterized protein n=1 Tax=Streptomyces sp. SID12501 TaxID=2706042 RepID=A0A6B3C8Z6_9ACTN|nr:hypothetical protein [Streptomyces sp. SID12501]NEC92600.1 hypothetical protein [Streptomyces sp. SID12501]
MTGTTRLASAVTATADWQADMAEGDMYAGDLLSAVITRSPAVWGDSAELRHELRLIVSRLVDLPSFLQQDVERFLAAGC